MRRILSDVPCNARTFVYFRYYLRWNEYKATKRNKQKFALKFEIAK